MSDETSRSSGTLAPLMLSAGTLIGDDVFNLEGDDLGDIKDVMLDMRSGRIAYVVLSVGGFLGMGEKLFAIPWSALTLDAENRRFVLSVEKDRLVNALGFDKDHWPSMADESWSKGIHSDHGATPHPNDFPV